MTNLRLLALGLLIVFAPPARAAGAEPDPAYLDELLASARSRELAGEQAWLRLGHWRERRGGGFESEADGPGFFLAPAGKTDPAAELEATLRAFFEPEPAAPSPLATPGSGSGATEPEPAAVPAAAPPPGEARPPNVDQLAPAHPATGPAPARPSPEHPQCRFPARFAFLAGALRLDAARLPPRTCPRFEAFWEKLGPRTVSFVFSSYYLNNPASAFGHTFLRVGRAEAGATERFDLVDQGIDYAATVDTGNAVLYAVKGMTGMFRGEFTARPYFYKVREYADFESRDLWDYELALTPAEVAMLVAHLWELGHTWFDYYYLTENCSYHILGVLEAAAPRLELLSRVGTITLPADSVKALFANRGLVRAIRFRPSSRTQFEARTASLSGAQLEAVAALAEGEEPAGLEAWPAAVRVPVLDAAVDLVDVRHGREMVSGGAPEADALRQRLLERRAAIPVASERLVVSPPALGGPERGHGSLRVGVGGGASSADGGLLVLDVRVALHDLTDPPAGFPTRTQLEFFKGRAAFAPRDGKFRLDEASLVEATSLNLFDRFERRASWKMKAGAVRVVDSACRECIAGRFEVGGGPALLAWDGALAAAVTADAELLAGDLHGAGGWPLRPGVGPGVLLRVLAGERVALLGTATWRWLPGASPETTFLLGAVARLHLGGLSLSAEWRRSPIATEVVGSVLVYGR